MSKGNDFVTVTVEADYPITIALDEDDFYIGTEDDYVKVTVEAVTDQTLEIPDPDTFILEAGESKDYETKPEPNETLEGSGTIYFPEVDLLGADAGNNPDISPKVCLNAQDEYKKAKWTAVVEPSGETADVTVEDGDVEIAASETGTYGDSLSGVSDADPIWVRAKSTASVGDYTLKITHNSLTSCTATDGSKVFKFVKEEVYNSRSEPMDEVWVGSDSNLYYPPLYSGGTTKNVKNGNDQSVDFETIAGWHLTKASGADFTVKLNGGFGVTTDPASGYSGEVTADLSSHFVGSARSENGVAYYTLCLKVDGTVEVIGVDGGRDSWDEVKSASNVQFTVDATDGSIDMGSAGTHSCAQRDLTMGTKISGVTGEHTVDLADFKIVSP